MTQNRAVFSKEGRLHDVVVVLLRQADGLFDLVGIDDVGGIVERTVFAVHLLDREVEGVRLEADFAVAYNDADLDCSGKTDYLPGVRRVRLRRPEELGSASPRSLLSADSPGIRT